MHTAHVHPYLTHLPKKTKQRPFVYHVSQPVLTLNVNTEVVGEWRGVCHLREMLKNIYKYAKFQMKGRYTRTKVFRVI